MKAGRRRRRGSGVTASRIPMLHALPIVWNCLSKRRSSLLATRQVVRRRSRTLLMSMLSLLWVLSDSTAYLESTVAADGILNVSYSKGTPEWQDYVPLNKIIATCFRVRTYFEMLRQNDSQCGFRAGSIRVYNVKNPPFLRIPPCLSRIWNKGGIVKKVVRRPPKKSRFCTDFAVKKQRSGRVRASRKHISAWKSRYWTQYSEKFSACGGLNPHRRDCSWLWKTNSASYQHVQFSRVQERASTIRKMLFHQHECDLKMFSRL